MVSIETHPLKNKTLDAFYEYHGETMDKKHTRYVILLDLIEGVVATPENVKGHIEFLRSLENKGILELAGPFTDFKGGMIIIKANSIDEAKAIAHTDPLVKDKIRSCEVRTWALSCEENNHLGRG